jgi:hypothetical protein
MVLTVGARPWPYRKYAHRAAASWIAFSVAMTGTAPAADAQQPRQGTPPLNLPRPGYEPQTIQAGAAVIRLQLDVSALYDSNVFATSVRREDDLVAIARPRVDIDLPTAEVQLHGEAYAEVRHFASLSRENSAAFGGAVQATATPGHGQAIDAELRYDRAIESRTDPERRSGVNDTPRRISILGSDLAYSIQGSRIGVTAKGGYQQFRYLDPLEHDRNLRIYGGSTSIAWKPSAPISFFVEGYVTRRDFATLVDLNGINRDATTIGTLLGVSREVSGTLRGRVGAGVFRFNPDDPQLSSYTGFAANGELTWSPRPRTALTGQIFRGDVATVRAGAINRTDTRLSLHLDQEARHNLLLQGDLSWLKTDYRGPISHGQNTFQGRAEAQYLVDRVFAPFAAVGLARRNADLLNDRFTRATIEIGVRIRH